MLKNSVLLFLLLASAPAWATPPMAADREATKDHAAEMAKAAAVPAPEHLSQPRGWTFRQAGLIPMQNGGRLKPLDSSAREAVLFVTGSRSYQGYGRSSSCSRGSESGGVAARRSSASAART